jgi:N utilization substance protein A
VKTDAQFEDMDIAAESRRAVSELFGDSDFDEEYTLISQLPGVDQAVAAILRENNKDFIEDFLALSEEELAEIGLSEEQQKILTGLIEEHIEIVEEEYNEEEEENSSGEQEDASGTGEEEFECPDCGAKITIEMTNCPNCGIGLSFEYEDDNIEG